MDAKKIIGHGLAFTVGLTGEFEYELVGTLRVSELILLGYLVLMTGMGMLPKLFSLPYAKTVASLGVVWLLGQYISDSVNDTSRINSLKGHAHIGMTLVSVAAMVLLFVGDVNRYASYLVGLFFCRLINRLVGVEVNTGSVEYWDLYIGGWASCLLILAMLFLLHKKFKGTMVAPMVIPYGCASMAFGGRSHGLIFLLTGVGLWYGARGGFEVLAKQGGRKLFYAGCASFLALLFIFQVYVYCALQGYLGTKPRAQLMATRNPYNPVQVLIAGRGGIQCAVHAISDAPIVGHGSRALKRKYITREVMRREGSDLTMIPVHSCILGAWVFSGILGLPFWIAAYVIHIRLYKSSIVSGHPQFIFLASYLLADSMWQILFSGHGYARFPWPPLLAVNIVLLTHSLAKQSVAAEEEPSTESVPLFEQRQPVHA